MPSTIKKHIIYATVAMPLVMATVVFIMFRLPRSEEQMQRSIALLECRTYCEMDVNGKALLYLDGCPDDWTTCKIIPAGDSIPYKNRYVAGQWTYRYMFLPVCDGTIIATETCTDERRRTAEFNKDTNKRIAEGINALTARSERLKRELGELEEYLRVHNVQDEGYNAIAEYAEKTISDIANNDSVLALFKGIGKGQKVKIKLTCKYTLLYNKARIACDLVGTDTINGTCTIQSHDKKTPEGAYPLFVRNPLANVSFSPKTKSIASYFNGKGLFTGYVALADSNAAYAGQMKNGRKQGGGILTDMRSRSRIVGKWNADTLVSATSTTPGVVYKGYMNRHLLADGHGISTGNDGSYYDGLWAKGKRNGFGCAVDSNGNVKVGEWQDGAYKGERMLYTPDRIYGIDISRHQHEKGRKRYAINWKNIRITHLGNISKKKVSGSVDYPVSFVYIKSTEGISVRNRYYASDYVQARKNGIKCGAYHFFSPSSDARRQANHFLRHSRFNKGDFPPVLDVEPTTKQVAQMGGPQKMFGRIRTWLNTVQSRTGMRPILYVNQQFVNKYLPLAPDIKKNYKIWIARYGEYKPDVKLVFWQLCPDGRVRGIHGDVDINVFNGYRDQYEKFLQDGTFW